MRFYDSLRPPSVAAPAAPVVEKVREFLERNLSACAPKNLGIVRLEVEPVTWDKEAAADFSVPFEPPGSLFHMEGIAGSGCRPLWAQFLFGEGAVHVMFILSPGRDAGPQDFGRKRAGKHNMVVLAVFGLSAVLLIEHGYDAVRNDQIDADVRGFYRRMGFADGESFELGDRGSVERLAAFAARCLRLFKIDPLSLRFRAGESLDA